MRPCMKWRSKKEDATHLNFDQDRRLTVGSDRPTHLTVNLHRTRSDACESICVSSSQEKHPLLRVFGVDAKFLYWGKFSGHDMGVRWADWTDWWFRGPAHPPPVYWRPWTRLVYNNFSPSSASLYFMVLIRQASTQSPPLTALAEWPQSNENKSNWPRHLPTPMKVGVKNTKYKNLSLMKTCQIGPLKVKVGVKANQIGLGSVVPFHKTALDLILWII